MGEMVLKFLEECLYDLVDTFGSGVTTIYDSLYIINRSINFDEIVDYATAIGILFTIICTIKIGLDTYVFYTDGDPDGDPLELIARGTIAITIQYCSSFIIEVMVKIASKCNKEILSGESLKIEDAELKNVMRDFTDAYMIAQKTVTVVIIVVGIVAISMAILTFKGAKRAAEIMLIRVLIIIFAADFLTATRERWKNFFWEIIRVIFGYILQVLCLMMSFYFMKQYILEGNFLYSIALVGWLILCIKAPEWLQKYLYSSGAGQMARGATQTAVSASMLMRFK